MYNWNMLELFGYMIYDDIYAVWVCPGMGDITQNCIKLLTSFGKSDVIVGPTGGPPKS